MPSETSSIPYDVLVAITAAYVKLHGTTRRYVRGEQVNSYRDIWPLSLVCKELNEICGHYIFEAYRFTLRANHERDYPPKLTERDEKVGFNVWDEEAVRERIQHFADRAHCVRTLTITSRADDEAKSFPEVIVPLLVDAINNATGLKSLTLKCSDVAQPLPKPIWDALLERNLGAVDIEGVRPPLDAPASMPTVKKLRLEWWEPVAGYMELFDPEQLTLEYRSEFGRPVMFQPTSATLQSIFVQYTLDRKPPTGKPIFDLSLVPGAAFTIWITSMCEYKMHIPVMWRQLKGFVRRAFSEGLDGYDVQRPYHLSAKISRPALVGPESEPNFEPRYQVHLEGVEAERREQEDMNDYYRMKAEREFGRYMGF